MKTSFLGSCLLGLSLVGTAAADEHGLNIYFIDVDGGAATLIVTPERESILIDSGWAGFEDRDPKRIVHVLKDIAGCDHLDHLVTTHWHMDHFGGVAGLSKLVEIKHFWDRGLPEDGLPGLDFPDGPKDDEALGIAYRKASSGKRKPLMAGDTLPLKGNVRAVVLTSGGTVYNPGTKFEPPSNRACESAPSDKPTDPSDNARSLSLIFHLGDFAFLDCGDLTWNVERKLVCDVDRVRLSTQPGRKPTAVDVFQVTHHGMDISNNPVLVKTIEPTVAIMNNGPRKGGSADTVRLLKGLPSIKALYALHKNLATGPQDNADSKMTANSDPKGGKFIQVNVAPDGSKYTVSIGETGEEQAFTTR